jgi:putative Mg2+ transporter-C (MgtC) family protein
MKPGIVYIELLGEVPLYFGIGVQVLTAVLLGSMVGYDREKKMKAAGLKTNILICLGATLYTSISLLNIHGFAVGPVDPNRVGAQIVSGIGFLGAGAIIQGRGNVIGMTTAATIWVVAAIGYTIGIGYPLTAAIFSLTVLCVLKLINPVYLFLDGDKRDTLFHIQVVSLSSVKRSVFELIKADRYEIDEMYEDKVDQKVCSLNLYIYASQRSVEHLILDIKKVALVNKVSFHAVEKENEVAAL